MIASPRSRSRRMSANSFATSCWASELVGSSSTSTRQLSATLRAISTSCCSATDRRPAGASSGKSGAAHLGQRRTGPLAQLAPAAPAGRASARRPAGCSRPPTGAAPATAPGRSSPRRRGGRRRATAGRYGSPSSSISPSSGVSAPLSTFMSVLLPAPFSPTSASTSPLRTSRSTPPSARVAPNCWRTPRMTSRGAVEEESVIVQSRRTASGGYFNSGAISASSMFSSVTR